MPSSPEGHSGHSSGGLDSTSGQGVFLVGGTASGSNKRACEQCIALKVKCVVPRSADLLNANASDPCRRCVKKGLECVFTTPKKRGRPRKGLQQAVVVNKEERGTSATTRDSSSLVSNSPEGSVQKTTPSSSGQPAPEFPNELPPMSFADAIQAMDFWVASHRQNQQQQALPPLQLNDIALMQPPMAPADLFLVALPSPEVVRLCLQVYIDSAERRTPMFHRSHLDSPSTLLLCSVLLVTPFSSWIPIPGTESPQLRASWERSLFQTTKRELLALLTSPPQLWDTTAVASLMVLRGFGVSRGLVNFSQEVVKLANRMAKVIGIISDEATMAVSHVPRWEVVANVVPSSTLRET